MRFSFVPSSPGLTAIALGCGGVFSSVQLAWAWSAQTAPIPSSPENLIVALLPSMIGGAAVALVSWGAIRIRVGEVERRISFVEIGKVSKDVMDAELRGIRGELHQLNTSVSDLIKDLVDRLDRRQS